MTVMYDLWLWASCKITHRRCDWTLAVENFCFLKWGRGDVVVVITTDYQWHFVCVRTCKKKKHLWTDSVVAFIDVSCYEKGNIRENVQLHACRLSYVGIRVVWSLFLVWNSRQNEIFRSLLLLRKQNCCTGDPNLKGKKQLRNCKSSLPKKITYALFGAVRCTMPHIEVIE